MELPTEPTITYNSYTTKSTVNLKKIIHTADIHMQCRVRHKEYLNVFDNLYSHIRKVKRRHKYKKDELAIIIAGDVFHEVLKPSNDSMQHIRNMFKILSQHGTVIVIAGNHDLSETDLKRMDSITPAVDSIDNVHYFKKSGLYRFGNMVFCVSSLADGKFIKRKDITCDLTEDMKCIALYHGALGGACDDKGFVIPDVPYSEHTSKSSSKYKSKTTRNRSIRDFDGFDLTLLGDIHKYQTLKDDKIVYAGSLIQRNHGESVDNHGIVEWSIKGGKFKHKHIPINNPYGYVTFEVLNGVLTPPIIDLSRFKDGGIYARFAITETSALQLGAVRRELQYAGHNLIDVKIIDRSKTTNGDDGDVDDDDGDTNESDDRDILESLIMDALTSHAMEHRYDEILDLHNQTKDANDKCKIDLTSPGKTICTPLELKFNNLFGYGCGKTHKMSLEEGITSITGRNAHGKTSILLAYLFTIYGHVGNTETKALNIVNSGEEVGWGQVEFEYGNVIYRLKRTSSKDNKSIDPRHCKQTKTLKYKSSDTGKWIASTPSDERELLEKIFGDQQSFIYNNTMSTRFSECDYIKLKASEQAKYLCKQFSLDGFVACVKDVKQLNKTVATNIHKITGKLENCNDMKHDLTKVLDKEIKLYNENYGNGVIETTEELSRSEQGITEAISTIDSTIANKLRELKKCKLSPKIHLSDTGNVNGDDDEGNDCDQSDIAWETCKLLHDAKRKVEMMSKRHQVDIDALNTLELLKTQYRELAENVKDEAMLADDKCITAQECMQIMEDRATLLHLSVKNMCKQCESTSWAITTTSDGSHVAKCEQCNNTKSSISSHKLITKCQTIIDERLVELNKLKSEITKNIENSVHPYPEQQVNDDITVGMIHAQLSLCINQSHIPRLNDSISYPDICEVVKTVELKHSITCDKLKVGQTNIDDMGNKITESLEHITCETLTNMWRNICSADQTQDLNSISKSLKRKPKTTVPEIAERLNRKAELRSELSRINSSAHTHTQIPSELDDDVNIDNIDDRGDIDQRIEQLKSQIRTICIPGQKLSSVDVDIKSIQKTVVKLCHDHVPTMSAKNINSVKLCIDELEKIRAGDIKQFSGRVIKLLPYFIGKLPKTITDRNIFETRLHELHRNQFDEQVKIEHNLHVDTLELEYNDGVKWNNIIQSMITRLKIARINSEISTIESIYRSMREYTNFSIMLCQHNTECEESKAQLESLNKYILLKGQEVVTIRENKQVTTNTTEQQIRKLTDDIQDQQQKIKYEEQYIRWYDLLYACDQYNKVYRVCGQIEVREAINACDQIELELISIRKYHEAEQHNINIDYDVQILTAEKADLDKDLACIRDMKSCADNINAKKKHLRKLDGKIESFDKELTTLDQTKKLYDTYIEIMGRDNIPSTLLERKMKKVERTINNIIKEYTGHTVKAVKNGKGVTFDVINKHTGFRHCYDRLSGYELVVFKVAYKLAINMIGDGCVCNIFWIDEALDCLDESNFNDKLKNFIGCIATKCSRVIITSHKDVSNVTDRNIEVVGDLPKNKELILTIS